MFEITYALPKNRQLTSIIPYGLKNICSIVETSNVAL